MELREALAVLGEERVRRGRRAIVDRREAFRFGICDTCFVAEAFGGTYDGYSAAIRSSGGEMRVAARTCEMWYEDVYEDVTRPLYPSWPESIGYPPDDAAIDSRAVLLREVDAYLRECEMIRAAEHGQHPEPAPQEAVRA